MSTILPFKPRLSGVQTLDQATIQRALGTPHPIKIATRGSITWWQEQGPTRGLRFGVIAGDYAFQYLTTLSEEGA